MHPVSKDEFFEITEKLLKTQNIKLNFAHIESNMNVLKYFIKFERVEYYNYNKEIISSYPLPDYFDNYYEIIQKVETAKYKLDCHLIESRHRNKNYQYSIFTSLNSQNDTTTIINVFFGNNLFDYKEYLLDYDLERRKQYSKYVGLLAFLLLPLLLLI
jgi:hypothetical protein